MRPEQAETAAFNGCILAFAFTVLRHLNCVSCVKNLLNFTCEELERFEQSTSLLQQPFVLTSSVLSCVLTHVQGTSELLFGDLEGGEGQEEELLMGKGEDREVLEPSVVLN